MIKNKSLMIYSFGFIDQYKSTSKSPITLKFVIRKQSTESQVKSYFTTLKYAITYNYTANQ